MKQDIIRLTPRQRARCSYLARTLCANCQNGCCLLLDDGEEHPCLQMQSLYGIACNYFREAVLPADDVLFAELTGAALRKRCARCGKTFVATSNRQKFCSACGVISKRNREKLRMRRNRALDVRLSVSAERDRARPF